MKEEKKWCVYCHTNKTNGKKYIGITSLKLYQRWRSGKGYKGNEYFTRAIKKYSWDGFVHEVLFDNISEIEAKQKEIELIKEYKTTERNNGYNITLGGSGGNGQKISKEERQRRSERMKNRILSEETKLKMSNSSKNRTKEHYEKAGKLRRIKIVQLSRNGIFIKKWDSEKEILSTLNYKSSSGISNACRRFGETYMGYCWMFYSEYIKYTEEEITKLIENEREDHFKKILQISKADFSIIKEWKCAKEIENELKFKATSIRGCCKFTGSAKTIGGFIWMYKKDYYELSENEKMNDLLRRKNGNHKKKQVVQLDLDYKIIKKWDSISDAGRIGYSISNITSCCKKNRNSHKGYKWMYYDDYIKLSENFIDK